MAIRTVGVIGTGVIGASWTGLFLAHGLRVLVSDPAPNAESKLQSYLESIWPTLEDVGLAPNASLSNYQFVGASMQQHYSELDFVQEVRCGLRLRTPTYEEPSRTDHAWRKNAPERLDLKTKLLGEIDAGTRPEVTIASSSSGIPSSQFIAQCNKAPERVLIGHPFNPPHLMPLVEVVPHPKTAKANIEAALSFYKSLGRRPVHIRQEVPGFAANRLQAVLCNEAYSLVSRGIMSAKDLGKTTLLAHDLGGGRELTKE